MPACLRNIHTNLYFGKKKLKAKKEDQKPATFYFAAFAQRSYINQAWQRFFNKT